MNQLSRCTALLAGLALAGRTAHAQQESTWDQPLQLARCAEPPHPLPAEMERVLSAVVTIQSQHGHGAGFIASPDGFVLTAAHVVSGQGELQVRGYAGVSYAAELLRVDPVHDVALLRIPGSGHPCLPPPAEAPPIGSELFAIGAPADPALSHTVSKGIISGRRQWESHRFLQTDASLNPGNSGGPLVNLQGEALALVSWKVAGSGLEGLSFGIPVTSASAFLKLEWGTETELLNVEGPVFAPGTHGSQPPVARPRSYGSKSVVVLPGPTQPAPDNSRYWVGPTALAGTGGAIVVGTWAYTRAAAPITKVQWRVAQVTNTLGWTVVGLGGIWMIWELKGRKQVGAQPGLTWRF